MEDLEENCVPKKLFYFSGWNFQRRLLLTASVKIRILEDSLKKLEAGEVKYATGFPP